MPAVNTGGYGRRYRIGTRLAHWQIPALLLAAMLQIPIIFAKHSGLISPLAYQLLGIVATSGVIITIGAEMYHERVLCTICAVNTPADIGAAAQRERRTLWWAHSAYATLILFGSIAATSWALIHLHSGWSDYVWLGVYGMWGLDAYAKARHRLLRPKCPYCPRWDEGGEHETVPEPTPPSQSPSPKPVSVTS